MGPAVSIAVPSLAFAVVLVVGVLLWHRRAMHELRDGWAQTAGWRRLRLADLNRARACPGCRSAVAGWRDRAHHERVCAPFIAYAEHKEQAITGDIQAHERTAETVGNAARAYLEMDAEVDTMLSPAPDNAPELPAGTTVSATN